ncbi:MAG TPA: transcription antitermination factor NusB [Oscillospiraceae bacterium]|nr:transcription antitermination factor NusB [Oscillospiraceae bacterium]
MTRSIAREIAVHLSYELGFTALPVGKLLDERLTPEVFRSFAEEDELYAEFPDAAQEAYIRRVVSGVGEHGAELDGYIQRHAVGWSFSRISRTAAAVMRVAMFEILYMPEIPHGAAINEAVEIAKHYETPETVKFVNGILGTFVRTEFPEAPSETEAGPDGGAGEPSCR